MELLLQLPSGAVLPMRAQAATTVAALKDRVRQQLGWAAVWPDFGLALGHVSLAEDRSLAANDLAIGGALTLFLRQC